MRSRSRTIRAAACAALTLAWLAGSGAAHAAGTFVAWRDCRVDGAQWLANEAHGCQSTITDVAFYPGFELAVAIDSVLAMELVIDVDVAAAALPAWWRMDPGQCNAEGWSADAAPSISCPQAWAGQGVAAVQGWLPSTPGGSPRHGRLLVATASVPGTLASLEANTPYTACRVILRGQNVLACEGCTTPACLVFNSVIIRRLLPGGVEQEIFVSGPITAAADRITWQGGTGADCQAVPVRAATWGAVKALVR